MEVVASLSQGRTVAAQCGLFTHKSVPVIFEPPCIYSACYSATKNAVFSGSDATILLYIWYTCSQILQQKHGLASETPRSARTNPKRCVLLYWHH